MLFSSLTFIFYFLPLCLILYYIIPKKFINVRNALLLVFSLVFYAWGEPKYIFLMLVTVFISWVFGLLMEKYKKKKKQRKIIFIISIIAVISSLLFFKYTNFFIENINGIFNSNIETKNIILPVGISFYSFQILSYLIDLYRGKIKVQKNFFSLSLYISFFPQLIAGPIVTYETIEDQLENRKETLSKIVSGAERFIIGLGKKVIIANNMALIADTIFNSTSLGEYSRLVLLLGILAYTFQIYFDFSGYSDMAIGLGKIFGFEFLENFNYPYMAKSVTDFWRRWHISLTTFFREYIYIPLGGNRVPKARWIFNTAVVWLLTGFWHGAAWTFIIWGLYYLVLLLTEKMFISKLKIKLPTILQMFITFVIVNIGWIIFRANNLTDLTTILGNLITKGDGITLIEFLNNHSNVISSLPYMLFAVMFSFNIIKKLDEKFEDSIIYSIGKKIILIIILVWCISSLVSSLYNPFIYYRF